MSEEKKEETEEKEQTMEEVWNELLVDYPIHDIVKFSEYNIADKLTENSWLITEYTKLYEKESDILNQVHEMKETIMCEQYDHYRFNHNNELKQSEIEKYYLPKDERVIKINKVVRKQQYRVNFFAMCVKALEKVYWNMRTFFDVTRKGA